MRHTLKREYEIVRLEYLDSNYVQKNLHFIVKERRRFLCFSWMSTVKEMKMDWGEPRMLPIQFRSVNEAREYINLAKKHNYKPNRWHTMVIEKITI